MSGTPVPLRRVAVLGAGTWGTTFAKVLADAGTPVTLWARRAEVAENVALDHCNHEYLPDVTLPAALAATADADEALDGADAVVLALPAQRLRENLERWTGHLPRGVTLVSLAKGVERGSLLRMSEVIREVTGAAADEVAVVSGPNLAGEIALEQPTATVVACSDHERAVVGAARLLDRLLQALHQRRRHRLRARRRVQERHRAGLRHRGRPRATATTPRPR